MNKILIMLLFFSLDINAAINAQCPQFTAYGAPVYQNQSNDQEICHQNYAVIYRCIVKAPIAVFEHLTKEDISGPAIRHNNFHPDTMVAHNCSASLDDYATVGHIMDRGHMSPAGNNTQNDSIMSESFNLSNMVAQEKNNNRGIWKQLETIERNLTLKPNTDYYIISGGIFDPGYKTTGNGLGIPTRLYKIIIEKNSNTVIGYLLPNIALPVNAYKQYQVPIVTIEQATGMRFNLGK